MIGSRGEQGSNAVEFALVLPMLLILVLGMLWGGLAFNTQLSLTQAAREGARFGATLAYPADGDWLGQVEERVLTSIQGQVGSSASSWVCIRAFDENGNLLGSRAAGPGDASDPACAGATIADAKTDGLPRVEVLVAHPARFEWVFGGGMLRLRADALARHEGGEK
jgi:Flp pilus assembly protein TadG